ncbi:MAG: hypothetical protein K1X78_03135 [Verrucomicrobiaceae bacterium]|nr:hypothetical protein [Verrucomicrobiaceae bacterium]
MDFRKHYIKTLQPKDKEPEIYHFHIHVDAQEVMPDETTAELLEAGLTHDYFDPDFHVYGRNGDPTLPFEHFAPVQHLTFVTSNAAKYREMWHKAVDIVERSGSECYVEGEFIVVDEPVNCKPFDRSAYDRIAPVVDPTTAAPFVYKSAIDGQMRSLPAVVTLRRLNPEVNGRRDRFRRGEMHLTLRDDVHPVLLELLCNLGFSVPAIPKLVEAENGSLKREGDGEFSIIRDMPLTLQTVDMREMMRVANLAVRLIEEIGGVADGSIKIEFATHFAVLNGVDYSTSVPPVLDKVRFRPDFAHLDHNHLGSIDANLARLTRNARQVVRTAPHQDKIARFKEIWSKTAQLTPA